MFCGGVKADEQAHRHLHAYRTVKCEIVYYNAQFLSIYFKGGATADEQFIDADTHVDE